MIPRRIAAIRAAVRSFTCRCDNRDDQLARRVPHACLPASVPRYGSVWLREARQGIGDGYSKPYKGEDSDLDVEHPLLAWLLDAPHPVVHFAPVL
jgi:hypothetical protein